MITKIFVITLLGIGLLYTNCHSAGSVGLMEQIKAPKFPSKLGSFLQHTLNQQNQPRERRSVGIPTAEFLTIDAIAKSSVEVLLRDLTELGLKRESSAGLIVSGLFPISALSELNRLDSLQFVELNRMSAKGGSVVSQGVSAMRADLAIAESGLDGSGVTVGVISDSFNCYAQSANPEKLARTAEIDKANGDLPNDAYALEEVNDCNFRKDEGRALMQIVHDIAPKANLVFLSGSNGIAATINGIKKLVDVLGVNIIVDDTALGSETFFQDDLIAQEIEQATKNGVSYITAVGNSGRNAYQSSYREFENPVLKINAHNFSDDGSTDVFQAFSLPEGSIMNLILQWSSPAYSVSGAPGAQTDLDISIINREGTQIIQSSNIINTSKDPIEFMSFTNPKGSGQTEFNIMITKAEGDPPELLKYIIEGRFSGSINEYATNSGTTIGRANTASAISVGSVDYRKSPARGATSPVLQHFSSAGGDTPILFNSVGEKLGVPITRAKPDIVGPDNVNTTFFNYEDRESDVENDSLPNFIGTSASAPHVAGVVALLLQLNPELSPTDIKAILQQSAVDVVLRDKQDLSVPDNIGQGIDKDSGSGYIDAQTAVNFAKKYVATKPIESTPTPDHMTSGDETQDSATPYGTVTVGGISVFVLLMLCYQLLLKMSQYTRPTLP